MLSNAPPLRVVLVEPQIPPNTGSIARLCAATGCQLVLLGQLGFSLDNAHMRRAGLDYWNWVEWEHHADWEGYLEQLPLSTQHCYSTKAERLYTEASVAPGAALIFGKETTGLPEHLLQRAPAQCYRIPVRRVVRSLNLSTAVGIVVYDVLRKLREF